MGLKMIQQNPFMLSLSKHVPLFFNNLLNSRLRTRDLERKTISANSVPLR
jgi:hypothetical protein